METQKPARISNYRRITARPMFRLVHLLEETAEYDKRWNLPFHLLSLFLADDERDPSWIEVEGKRSALSAGVLAFTAARTPMRIRYAAANHHMGIHFRYELFPGVDALSGLRGRFVIDDPGGTLAEKVKSVFADTDPVRRYAAAESVALEAIHPFWPERPALDLLRLAPYADALRTVADTLDAKTGVRDLAERMGVRGTQFARTFSALLGMTPHEWLEQALLDRALAMLADPGRTVKDVAYELEFSTEFNFSRFVKRLTGLPPSRLRS